MDFGCWGSGTELSGGLMRISTQSGLIPKAMPLTNKGYFTYSLPPLVYFWPRGMQDLNSSMRDRTHAPCSGSTES